MSGVTEPVRLSRGDARRIAVRAQLLDSPRPTDAMTVLRRLALVQVDLTAAVAPSADVVLWSRLGSEGYRSADLDELLGSGQVVEHQLRLRPAEDLRLFTAAMRDWPGPDATDWQLAQAEWVDTNEECCRDILDMIEREGPLPAKAFPDTTVVPWRSSGWNDNRNVTMLVQLMEERGDIAVAHREGRDRLWDLAERVHPDDPPVPREEARGIRARRWLEALGITSAKAPASFAEGTEVGESGVAAVVEGVRGTWRVDEAQLDRLGMPFEGRTALLSPIDRLVFDRKRMEDLFEFDYQLEMYKPAAKRRWGYWALPVLHGDRLVGKVDATSDHAAGVLRVDAVHEDEPFSKSVREGVDGELEDLAQFLGLRLG